MVIEDPGITLPQMYQYLYGKYKQVRSLYREAHIQANIY